MACPGLGIGHELGIAVALVAGAAWAALGAGRGWGWLGLAAAWEEWGAGLGWCLVPGLHVPLGWMAVPHVLIQAAGGQSSLLQKVSAPAAIGHTFHFVPLGWMAVPDGWMQAAGWQSSLVQMTSWK